MPGKQHAPRAIKRFVSYLLFYSAEDTCLLFSFYLFSFHPASSFHPCVNPSDAVSIITGIKQTR